MQLIQILLPLHGNDGMEFPRAHYDGIRRELTKKFGGLTAFTRAPAEGFWKDNADYLSQDDIIIFEVMLKDLNASWWSDYKRRLEALFAQDEIIIRTQDIALIQ